MTNDNDKCNDYNKSNTSNDRIAVNAMMTITNDYDKS